MNLSIKPYLSGVVAKIPNKEESLAHSKNEGASANPSTTKKQSILISSTAQARYIQSSAPERQSKMSKGELNSLHSKSQSELYNFSLLIYKKNYNRESLLAKTDDPERLAISERSLNYAIGLSLSPPKFIKNPFEGMARNDVSAIVYDDTGTFTDAERYAAYGELSRQDEEYFSKLATKLTNGGDNREFFKGILDYFDDLPPVEKSPYPDSYRASIDSLYQEQLGLWGPFDQVKQSTKKSGER
jgi:hypothetical protein